MKGSLGPSDPTSAWLESLVAGERRTLSRLLTYAESRKNEHQELVASVLSSAKGRAHLDSSVIGVTGAPGAGKSCLVEALGVHLLARDASVAVLSVDPSSEVSGGSILGDKLRMPRLASTPRAYVRSVASQCSYGGLSPGSMQAVELLRLAGYDYIFVETVGVGQSEVDVAAVCNCLVLVLSPTEGDDVQGFKRGITEHVDLVAVNKADIDFSLAQRIAAHYQSSLTLLRDRPVQASTVSATKELGLAELWHNVELHLSEAAKAPNEERLASALARLVARKVEARLLQKMREPEAPELKQLIRAKCRTITLTSAAEEITRRLFDDQ